MTGPIRILILVVTWDLAIALMEASIGQAVKCITVGGNSPITDSCTNKGTNTNTNSGGNVGSGNSANGGEQWTSCRMRYGRW